MSLRFFSVYCKSALNRELALSFQFRRQLQTVSLPMLPHVFDGLPLEKLARCANSPRPAFMAKAQKEPKGFE